MLSVFIAFNNSLFSGTFLWCRYQSPGEGWWSCCPDLCNQTGHFKGIGIILPEV